MKYILIFLLLTLSSYAYAGHGESINNSQLPIISANKIPAPTVSTLGGVKAFTAVTSEFITSIDINGNITAVQPNFSDLSGTATATQMAPLLAAANTWTATQAFGALSTTGAISSTANGGGSAAGLFVQSANPYVAWSYSGGGTDAKFWQMGAAPNSFNIGLVNDANSASVAAISISRSANVLTNVQIPFLSMSATQPTADLIFGVNQRSALRSTISMNDPNNAEGALYLYSSSAATSPAPASGTYAIGIMNAMTVYPDAKPGLAANFVCQMAAGFTAANALGCSGIEIDVYGGFNSSGSSYANPHPKNGILLNGSYGFTNSNAIEILGSSATSGSNPLWDVGIRIGQNTPNLSTIASVSIWDQSYAPVGYQNSGVQQVAINLIGSYSSRSISAPGMLVDGFGNIVAKSFTTGSVTSTGGTGVGVGDITDTLSGGTGYYDTGNHTNGFTQTGSDSVGISLSGAYASTALIINGVLNGTNAITVGTDANPKFRVASGGTVQAQAYQVGTGASPTVGASCGPGAPTSSFQVVGGLVTHC